jgi:MFS family permease
MVLINSIYKSLPIVVTTIYFMLQLSLQISLGPFIGSLVNLYHLNQIQLGLILGSYYIVYGLMQFPAGFIVDEFGVKKTMFFGSLVTLFGCIVFISSYTFINAIIGRILYGLGLSCAFVCMYASIENSVNQKYKTLVLALCEIAGLLAMISFHLILKKYTVVISLIFLYKFFSISSAIISILILLISFDSGLKTKKDEYSALVDKFWICLKHFSSDIQYVYLGLYTAIGFSVISILDGAWLIKSLELIHHFSFKDANLLSVHLLLGMMIGAPLMGVIDTYRPVYKKCCYALCPLFVVISLGYFFITPGLGLVVTKVILFITGLFSCSYLFGYIDAALLTPSSIRSSAAGFINSFVALLAGLIQALIGFSLSFFHEIHHVHAVHDFAITLSILPFLFMVAVLLGILMKRNLMNPAMNLES